MAVTTPVIVVAYADPPLTTDFETNQWVTVRVTCLDRTTKLPIDVDATALYTTNPPASITRTLVAMTRDAVGTYHADVQLTAPGRWLLNFVATRTSDGAVVGSWTGEFMVYNNGQ